MLSLRFVLTLSLIFVGTAPFFIPLTAHADDAGTEFKLTGMWGSCLTIAFAAFL